MDVLAGMSLVALLLLLVAIGFSWGFVVGARMANEPAPPWLRRLVAAERERER